VRESDSENDNEKEENEFDFEELSDDLKINWFPGHMAKALRLLKDTLKRAHIVIDVRDSRVSL